MAKTATSSTSTQANIASETVAKFTSSWDYAHQNHHARWRRNRKLYNNERVMVGYEGTTNTFVPMVFSTVETITSALCGGRPSIDFVPQDMYQYVLTYYQTGKKPDLKALNAQFDYYWDCDNWDLKSVKTVRNALIDGLSGEWIWWEDDKPRIQTLKARDIIFDPSLTDPMDLIQRPKDFYSGRRYLTTLTALKGEEIVDPDKPGETKKRFKNLPKVTGGWAGAEETDEDKKAMFLGATGANSELVEVIEIWTGEKIRSVANRTWLIEDRDNELGTHCLVLHRFIAHEDVVYGKAIVDPIAQLQEQLNDTRNQGSDAITDVLAPQFELDPLYADYIDMVTNAPLTVYPFAPGSLKKVDKDTVSPQHFTESGTIKQEINEATGVDQIVKGGGADPGTTATEIKAQLNQAGQRFELYVRMLEKEAFYQRAKIVYKMMLHFVTDKQLVPTQSVDGPKFLQFDPANFDETYEPKIQLEASVQSGKNRQQQSSTEAYQILIQDPSNDLWEAKKILYPKMFDLTEEELDRIIGANKPQEMAPAGGEDPMADPSAMPPEPLEGVVV